MKALILAFASSAALCGGWLLGADESRKAPPTALGPSVQRPSAPVENAVTPVSPKDSPGIAELQAMSARIAELSKTVAALEARIRRSLRRVPTAEEFRQQVADGRREIEKRRAAVAARWNEVKRLAEAKQVKLEGAALRGSVPEALKADAEFLAARDRALHDARLVDVLEERLINVMLTTSIGGAGPPRATLPPESAIERERQNLAAAQKSVGVAVQNAMRKAAAANAQFNPSMLLQERPAVAGVAADRAVLDAVERARAQLRARDTSAELLAELEFSRAVGPLGVNW